MLKLCNSFFNQAIFQLKMNLLKYLCMNIHGLVFLIFARQEQKHKKRANFKN